MGEIEREEHAVAVIGDARKGLSDGAPPLL
jgi:hypothetical protein